ncbi:MAG: prephenate dehydrogenase [Chloroflexi bacterium]|nr:prephenate dehydrogenase [Chloroflexota bacterium]
MENKKLTIIGTGLVGGSLGLALKESKAPFRIVGHDRELGVAKKAQGRGAVDAAEWNLISALEGAALVFIATPLPGVKEVLEKGAKYFLPGAIITDTAPAKEKALEWSKEFLPREVHFIGGHPILSESGKGIDAAQAELFRGKTWCLVPAADADPAAAQFLAQMVQGLGAQPFFMDAAEHDGQVTALEHLPPLLAAALFHIACYSPAWRDMARLVSSTFQQATNLAEQDPESLSQLALSNPENLSRWIEILIAELRRVQALLNQKKVDSLKELFADPTENRERWLARARADEEALSRGLEEAGQAGTLGGLFGYRPRRPGKE